MHAHQHCDWLSFLVLSCLDCHIDTLKSLASFSRSRGKLFCKLINTRNNLLQKQARRYVYCLGVISTDTSLPKNYKGDLIVADMIGSNAIEEGVLATTMDPLERFLFGINLISSSDNEAENMIRWATTLVFLLISQP